MGMFLRRGAVASGPKLGDIEVGTIVKLNENGSPVEFYVAKHDYETGLNGSGRTLVVRKECYDKRVFTTATSGTYNDYQVSTLDSFLNNNYFAMLDPKIRSNMGKTKFYSKLYGNDGWVDPLERSVFTLSVTELGLSPTGATAEGTALPIASILRALTLSGSYDGQWTRTPAQGGAAYIWVVTKAGNAQAKDWNDTDSYSRPAMTLPAGFRLDDSNVIVG